MKALIVMGVALALALLGGLVVLGITMYDRRQRLRQEAAPGDLEARRIALQAVRLLDRALADPMVRQSTGWEDQAKALVEGYYGKGLKA